jgi:hypothetical protein
MPIPGSLARLEIDALLGLILLSSSILLVCSVAKGFEMQKHKPSKTQTQTAIINAKDCILFC